jgi:hypothetical protein
VDERSILIISFGIGVAVQAVLMLRGGWNWWKIAGCVAVSLLAFMPGKHEHVYNVLFHVLMALSFFSFTFAMVFRKDILPMISEAVLLSYSLIFWYAFLSYSYDGSIIKITLAILVSVPTIITLYISCRKIKLNFPYKLILYTWFLCIVVSLGLFQFPFSQLALFLKDRQIPWTTPLESITAGMAFLFLASNATYIFFLIPIPGKNQSWKDRMKEWHEFTDLLTQRVTDDQIDLRGVAAIVAAMGLVLVGNFLYDWVPSGLIINISIAVSSALTFLGRPKKSD